MTDGVRHIISILLQNEAGALARVANLFSTRGYNIESLNVAPTHDPTVSRLTLVTAGSETVMDQIIKQLGKLVDVVNIIDMTDDDHIERELALFKIQVEGDDREIVTRAASEFGATVLDDHEGHFTVELTGDSGAIDRFVNRDFGAGANVHGGARRSDGGCPGRAHTHADLVGALHRPHSFSGAPMNSHTHNAERLARAKRCVVKIGSTLFVDGATGSLQRDWLEGVCTDVADMHARGQEVVIVSSGAIALGAGSLGIDPLTHRLQESQAAAAAGQIRLAHAYQELLAAHGIAAAQVLLTLDDSENRRRYLNAANTLFTLLKRGAVPVINENDTVATEEIRYGDNDRLAARVAQMVSADCLILLSDVDGFYSADPNVDPEAEHIAEISALTEAHLGMAGGAGSAYGSGGMRTKLDAARIAMGAGCRMVIASGRVAHPLRALAGRRQSHLVPARLHAQGLQETVDRRHPEATRHADRGRRGQARAGFRAQPPAGGSHRGRRAFPARRRRAGGGPVGS